MPFSRQWYTTGRKRHRNKGLFGGKIMSHAEIKQLNERILKHEANELAASEEELENKLKQL